MKYIAVLDTDEIEDFAFFEDGKEKYLHGIYANSINGEWIYLPFKPLEQEPVIDKVKQAREEIENLNLNDYGDNLYQFQVKCTEILDKLIESEDKE